MGGYIYQKSLNIPNTMTPAAMSAIAAGGLGMGFKVGATALSHRIQGWAGGGNLQPNTNFLSYLLPFDLESRTVGQYEELLTPEDTGLAETVFQMQDIEELTWFPKIPTSFVVGTIAAFSLGIFWNELGNLKAETELSTGLGFKGEFPFVGNIPIAPRMNYYRKGNEDVFSIRGTATYEDVGNDAALGLGDRFSPTLKKKMDIYQKFINDNSRGRDITIVGHSLGQVELGMLIARMENKNINGVGFGVPFFPPHPTSINYSFKHDPLYVKNGLSNHKVIEKPFKKYEDRFGEHHSISNYF